MLLRCVEPPMSQMGHSHRFPDVRVTSACAPDRRQSGHRERSHLCQHRTLRGTGGTRSVAGRPVATHDSRAIHKPPVGWKNFIA